MYLKPSNIYFSQDSINNVFDKRCSHSYKRIGETLDEICEGRCSVNDIPTISVVWMNGKWVTADNRRLWVFRQLERLGKCDEVFVQKGFYIPDSKMTSENGGLTVQVRGSPGGYWHTKSSAPKTRTNTPRSPGYSNIYDFNSTQINNKNTVTNTCQTPVYDSHIKPASGTRKIEIKIQEDDDGRSRGLSNFGGTTGLQRYEFNKRSTTSNPDRRVYRHKTYQKLDTFDRRLEERNVPSNHRVEDEGCCVIL